MELELCKICKNYCIRNGIKNCSNEINFNYTYFCEQFEISNQNESFFNENLKKEHKQITHYSIYYSFTNFAKAKNSLFFEINSEVIIKKDKKHFNRIIIWALIVPLIAVIADFFWHHGINYYNLLFCSILSLFIIINSYKESNANTEVLKINKNGIKINSEVKLIPWELIYHMIVINTSSGSKYVDVGYRLKIFSINGNFEINISHLDIKVDGICSAINFYKDYENKYNKLKININDFS